VGECVVRGSTVASPGFGATFAETSIQINKATLNYTANSTKQYSDPILYSFQFDGFQYSDTLQQSSAALRAAPPSPLQQVHLASTPSPARTEP